MAISCYVPGTPNFTDTNPSPTLEIIDPAVLLDWSAGIGINLNKHWGAEWVAEMYETNFSAPGFNRVSEYSLWNVLTHLRWRYPLFNDRLVPYIVGGAGWGWTNVNDPKPRFSTFPIHVNTDDGFVASLGGGVDYFIAENVSMALETRYIAPFETDVRIGAQTIQVDNSTLLFEFGLRIYFQ